MRLGLMDEQQTTMTDAPELETESEATAAGTDLMPNPVDDASILMPDSAPEATATTQPRPLAPRATADRGGFYWGTGRRKRAVARVRIRPAAGGQAAKFIVNGKPIEDYFSEARDRKYAVAPLEATSTTEQFEIFANLHGGGYAGQAGALLLGLSRALKGYDPSLEQTLRDHDMLSVDPRQVERKKPGQPGARKRFQFSKR